MPTGIPKSGKRKCGPRVERVQFVCQTCHRPFEKTPGAIKQRVAAGRTIKFCSSKCAGRAISVAAEAQRGYERLRQVACSVCQTQILRRTDYPSKRGVYWCSKECREKGAPIVGRQIAISKGQEASLDFSRWKDPEHIKSYMRNYCVKNIERLREPRRVQCANRRALLRKSDGKFTVKEWEALCLACNYVCVACLKRTKLTVDHIVPLIMGGSNRIENIQPLCATCNKSKGAKHIDYLSALGIRISSTDDGENDETK